MGELRRRGIFLLREESVVFQPRRHGDLIYMEQPASSERTERQLRYPVPSFPALVQMWSGTRYKSAPLRRRAAMQEISLSRGGLSGRLLARAGGAC